MWMCLSLSHHLSARMFMPRTDCRGRHSLCWSHRAQRRFLSPPNRSLLATTLRVECCLVTAHSLPLPGRAQSLPQDDEVQLSFEVSVGHTGDRHGDVSSLHEWRQTHAVWRQTARACFALVMLALFSAVDTLTCIELGPFQRTCNAGAGFPTQIIVGQLLVSTPQRGRFVWHNVEEKWVEANIPAGSFSFATRTRTSGTTATTFCCPRTLGMELLGSESVAEQFARWGVSHCVIPLREAVR